MHAHAFKMLSYRPERWNDKRGRKFSILADHHQLGNERGFFHQVFDSLWSDVFASGSLEDFLFAVSNFQENPVKLADVPGVKPSFRINNLSCQLGLAVVAHHHVGATIKNFAVFGDFYAAAGYHRPDRADFVASLRQVVYSNNRRCLSRTVALKYRHSRGPENASQSRLQRSRTRNNGSDSSSETGPPSRKNKEVSEC